MIEEKYLKLLEKKKIQPNFFCSKDYWKFAEWKIKVDKDLLKIINNKKEIMLPPYNIQKDEFDYDENYWVGFSDMEKGKFLDYEFIYDPLRFFFLEGKRWKLFRKNIRKFRNEVEKELFYDYEIDESRIWKFLERWFRENDGREWYEPEVMLRTILKSENKLFLVGKETHRLYSIMAYDENYQYINFRYLLCLNYPKIQDISRLMFYRWIAHFGKLVNDGGCLDNKGLKWYKERLNPIKINKIYGKEFSNEDKR